MFKRVCSLILALVFLLSLCALCEGDVAELARAAGLKVSTEDNPDGAITCDYTVDSSEKATMTWSDASHLYSASGDAGAVSQLYVDALSLGGWDSCRYIVGRKARISFGTKSRKVCDTLEDYLGLMEAELGVTAGAAASEAHAAASPSARLYVLNTNTKKFHCPSCTSVSQMKAKNRKDYTGTRDEIIAMGYQPCKRCNP